MIAIDEYGEACLGLAIALQGLGIFLLQGSFEALKASKKSLEVAMVHAGRLTAREPYDWEVEGIALIRGQLLTGALIGNLPSALFRYLPGVAYSPPPHPSEPIPEDAYRD